jgi:hypothetical protein
VGGKNRFLIGGTSRGSSAFRRHRRRLALVAIAAGLAVAAVPLAFAGGAPSATPLPTAYVTDGTVSAIAHADNRTYIGGKFTHVGPRVGHGLAFARPDGTDGTGGAISPTWPEPADDTTTDGDPAFPQMIGGEVRAVASDEHGGWYVGGDFTDVGGQPPKQTDGKHRFSRLVHILPGGELDRAWQPNPNEPVLALTLSTVTPTPGADPIRTLYVGGRFTSTGGVNRNYLAAYRLKADGTPYTPTCSPAPEQTACPTTGPGSLSSQGYQGTCTPAAGQTSCGLDPKTPLNWKPEPKDVVRTLVASDVKVTVTVAPALPVETTVPVLFVGGDFVGLGSNTTQPTINRVGMVWGVGAVKPDGSSIAGESPSSWNPGPTTAGNSVRAVAVRKIETATGALFTVYFGGDFVPSSGPKHLSAAQLTVAKADGAPGPSFSQAFSNWLPAPNGPVRALAVEQTGANPLLYVGGDFTKIGQQATQPDRRGLAVLSAIREPQMSSTSCAAADCPANAADWNPNPDGAQVASLAVSEPGADQVIFAGGDFTKIGAVANPTDPQPQHNYLAAIAGPTATIGPKTPGQALDWDPKLAGFLVSPNGTIGRAPVNALGVQGDEIYAGGAFNSAGAELRRNLAALDGSGELDEAWTPSPDATVRAIAPAGDVLYIGGDFLKVDNGADSASRVRLAALDATTGVVDPTWAPSATSICTGTAGVNCTLSGYPTSCRPATGQTTCELPTSVMGLDVTKQTVYVAGAFAQVAGSDRLRLAAVYPVDGVNEDGLPAAGQAVPDWAPQANSNVYAVDASCDTVYAGGAFTKIGEPPTDGAPQPERSQIAALAPVGAVNGNDDPIGGQATAWHPDAEGVVRALDTSRNRQTIYAGGQITKMGGATRQKLGAVRAADGLATGWNPSGDGTVYGLAVSDDDQTVYVGGSFFSIGGETRSRLAALKADGVGDGTGDATGWAPEPNEKVEAVATRAATAGADKVYAGGSFTEMENGAQSGFAAFGPAPVLADAAAGDEVPDCTPVEEPPRIESLSFGTDKAFHYHLSERSTVAFRFARRAPGIRIRKPSGALRCVRDTAANRRRLAEEFAAKLSKMTRSQRRRFMRALIAKRRCTVLVSAGSFNLPNASKGDNTTTLAALGASLAAGSYRATLVATDKVGNTSLPSSVDFSP